MSKPLQVDLKPKKKKKVLRFFKYDSLNPTQLNQAEIYALGRNSSPDQANQSLRRQARGLSTSVSLTGGFFETIKTEVLGEEGIRLNVTTENKDDNEKIEKSFKQWKEFCCLHNVYDFEDYEEMLLESFYRDGECFVHFVYDNELKIEILNADRIDNNYNDEKNNISYGIQRKKDSLEPLNYFYRKDDKTLIKIPAEQMLHIRKTLIPEQVRGNSKLATSLNDTHKKSKFKDAELDRTRLNSEITGFYVRKGEDGGIFEDEDEDNIVDLPEKAVVGKMSYIDADIEPKFLESHNPTNLEYYLKSTDREVAKSLGISYSTYTGDLRDVNFSSIRQGTMSERRSYARIQRFLIRKFHNKIFRHWLKNELISNRINAKQYTQIKRNFSFKGQAWEYIDPTKEVDANIQAIQGGFKTRTEVLRSRGIEVDDFIHDLKKDKEIVDLLHELEKDNKESK